MGKEHWPLLQDSHSITVGDERLIQTPVHHPPGLELMFLGSSISSLCSLSPPNCPADFKLHH